MRRWLLLLVFLLLPVTARADFLWDLRVGAKAAVTGNLWAAPDGAPRISGADAGWQNALFFAGGGGGLMVELHALKFLALEVDVLYEQNGFKESINVTQPKDWQERFDSFDAARGTFVVKASESFQFALLAGVAYVF